MNIAVDAMGGDYAPVEIIKGAVQGAREYKVGITLVGPQEKIQTELAKYDIKDLDIEIVHTEEYLIEGEQPAYALRTKRNASIALAVKLVKDGKAQAVVSMGPTGGVITSALMYLGTVEGISRPVIGGCFCGFTPQTVTMDIGGNIEIKAEQLLDFAIVGTVYARKLLEIDNPSVALLNVGIEEGKGTSLLKEGYSLLKRSGLNFIGNIEGNQITDGKANVIICDGYIGNVVTKFCEGLGRTIADWFVKEVAGELAESRVEQIKAELLSLTVKADTGGGGPLWAVNGAVFKGHGRSKSPEMAITIGSAKKFVELDVISALKTELAVVRSRIKLSSG